MHDWTDEYPWTEDEVLMWVSVYLFSREGPGASVRIYYESMHPDKTYGENISRWDLITSYIPRVPLALSPPPTARTILRISVAASASGFTP